MNEDLAALIPFYLNRTLSDEETKAVETALLEDEAFREEFFHWLGIKNDLAAVGQVHARTEAPADPERLLLKLKKRTTLYIPFKRSSARYLRVPVWAWQPAAVLIVALQLLALGLFIAGIHVEKRAEYRVLSTPQAGAAASVQVCNVIFQPETTEQEIRTLLLTYRAQFVEGPNRIGLYRIRFEGSLQEKLEQFQKEPVVRFVERTL